MNALIYSINEINFQIPHELLQAGILFDENEATINLTSLDDKILNKVIKKRVLLDANIVGGIQDVIPLNGINPIQSDYYYTIYNIPNEMTRNKEIISVLNMTILPMTGFLGTNFSGGQGSTLGMTGGMTNSNNALINVSNRIGNSVAPGGLLANTLIDIVGHNTVMIQAAYHFLTNVGLRVVLANDTNLNNIQPRSYKDFSLMCVLAVKSYLYNKLIVPINSGYLSGGQELGMFKNILESYSSAEEEYRTYINEIWGGIAKMNDTTTYHRLLRSMMDPSA